MRATSALVQRVAVALRKMQQPDDAGLRSTRVPIAERLVVADDEVALPMPGFGAILGSEWAVVDGQHRLLEPRPAALEALVSAAVVPTGAQRRATMRRQRRRPQQSRSRLVDGLIDALVA